MASITIDQEDDLLAPNLQNLIENTSLQWIFVGGKGGVGKSTTSCSLATALAAHREKVLIVSLDPAHNLSDAFDQQLSSTATLVNGFDNLFALETDPKSLRHQGQSAEDLVAATSSAESASNTSPSMSSTLREIADLATSAPGMDEALALMQLMKMIEENSYDVIVFDTAPTGHTLNLLRAPIILRQALEKIDIFRQQLGGMLSSVMSMLQSAGSANSIDDLFAYLDRVETQLAHIMTRFQDPSFTTFVCVAIPEFLSLFETERLVQELTSLHIDVQNIVVNQVLYVNDTLAQTDTANTSSGNDDVCSTCPKCRARRNIQNKYIEQFQTLYEFDFHLIFMPLLDNEVRGKHALTQFGSMLISGNVHDSSQP